MNLVERQKIATKLVSGVVRVKHTMGEYFIHEPTMLQKSISEDVYEERLESCIEAGVLSEDEILDKLISVGLWSDFEQSELDLIPELLSKMKMNLYLAYKALKQRKDLEKEIDDLKKKFSYLTRKRNIFRLHTAEGSSEAYKYKYLICCNTRNCENELIWKNTNYLEDRSGIVDVLIEYYFRSQPSEELLRELVRQEPWRSLWNNGKSSEGIFGKPSCQLTPSQKALMSWSRIYDNVYESPEAPPEEVIENDDLMDGWLTYQSKKREEDKKKNSASEKATGVKGDEVFLMADSENDASRVFALNNAQGKSILKTRQKQMKKAKKGLPAEKTFDAQMEMREMAMEQFKNHVKK